MKPVETSQSWMPISIEMKADMGLPLTDKERAYLDEQEARYVAMVAAYHRSWRYRLRLLYRAWYWFAHVLHAIRGLDCCPEAKERE